VRALEEAESYLRSVAMRLTRAGVDVSAITSSGDFAEVIESEARSQGVDLIVMATHGRWGVDRLLHGSLAESVLARANQPMLVFGPKVSASAQPYRVLVPLDGGPFSAAILPEVSRFARSFGLKHIDLLSVLPAQAVQVDELDGAPPAWALEKMGVTSIGSGTYALKPDQPIVHERARELEHALEYWADWLGDSGAEVHTHVRYDLTASSTAQSTLRMAEEIGADIIAMRTHARRGINRAMAGSVADEVVRTSTLPVLLYTTGALEDLAGAAPRAEINIQT
jgi:nucleotide-binding universal stress UspA family protein